MFFIPRWDNIQVCKKIKAIIDNLPPEEPNARDLNYEYNLINCPILLIKNERSRVLSSDNLIELLVRENTLKRKNLKRKLNIIVAPNYGHVPAPLEQWCLEDVLEFYNKENM